VYEKNIFVIVVCCKNSIAYFALTAFLCEVAKETIQGSVQHLHVGAVSLTWIVWGKVWLRWLVASGWGMGHSMWDFWWTKWHWDRFFFKFFDFPLSVSFHQGSLYSYIMQVMNKRPFGGHSSDILSPHWHVMYMYDFVHVYAQRHLISILSWVEVGFAWLVQWLGHELDNWDLIPGRSRHLSLLCHVTSVRGPTVLSGGWGGGQLRCEADHCPPPGAEVKHVELYLHCPIYFHVLVLN
jgi:hypothetical protein